jgi:hypothetical protein
MEKNVIKSGPGVWTLKVGSPTKVITSTGHTLYCRSTVLFQEDDDDLAVYVLEGLVTEWTPSGDKLLAAAWADRKIVYRNGSSTPSMEPFTWDEVDRVWREAMSTDTPRDVPREITDDDYEDDEDYEVGEAPEPFDEEFLANRPLEANFILTPPNPTADDDIDFQSLSTGPSGVSMRLIWFVDGEEETEMENEESWVLGGLGPGEHLFRLVVEDGRGNRDEVTKRVLIRP